MNKELKQLTEAYQSVYSKENAKETVADVIQEDVQDASKDEQLKKHFGEIVSKHGCNGEHVGSAVSELFAAVQQHLK